MRGSIAPPTWFRGESAMNFTKELTSDGLWDAGAGLWKTGG